MDSIVNQESKHYWNNFYKDFNEQKESTFCRFIRTKVNQKYCVIDVGCGNGRDTFSFYEHGFKAVGLDRSSEVINRNKQIIKETNLDKNRISFFEVDIGNGDKFLNQMADFKSDTSIRNLLIYNRFFIHSINKETEENFIKGLTNVLSKGDLFVSEFRTIEDAHERKIYHGHYRRYIDSDSFIEELKEKYNFKIKYFYKGKNLSIYKNENPYLARVIAEKI